MNIHDYLIGHAGFDWRSLLEEWRWILPAEFRVWLLTRSGDLFITLSDGSINMLDVGAGELRRVAVSREEACTLIDDAGVAEDWLMIPIVDQLIASGAVLGPGQCYSFRQLPTLGGSYVAENRMVFPINEHFGAWGSIQRQISELPDGTEIAIKPVA